MFRNIVAGLVLVACLLAGYNVSDGANLDAPWAALQQLDIPKAKELFSAALKRDPNNESLKRGLLLAAYFDLDHATVAEMVNSLATTDKASPYLAPVFELVAAEFDGWSDALSMQRALADAMEQSPIASVRYCGEMANESKNISMIDTAGAKKAALQYVHGAWVMGPFDNHSDIAAYRKLPFETATLDTTADTTGVMGVAAPWWWVEQSVFGELEPMRAFENVREAAFQVRSYFELPADMAITLVMGGPYCGRIYIDGAKVYDDPIMRNAYVREGVRAHLTKGAHELMVVVATNLLSLNLRMAIRDGEFKPIDGLTWLRDAKVKYDTALASQKVHPIFQPFDSLIEAQGSSPDTRFWKAILQMFNGYANESISDLEALLEQDKLTNLERWALIRACQANNEDQRLTELIGQLKQTVSTPRSDMVWATVTNTSHQELINGMATLDEQYPGRPEIQVFAQMKKALTGDLQGYVTGMQDILQKEPNAAMVHNLLAVFYRSVAGDNEAALRETETYFQATGERYRRLPAIFDLYMKMAKYDDAMKIAQQLQELDPGSDAGISRMLDASQQAMKLPALEPILKDLIKHYPYNIEAHSNLYALYRATSQFKPAKQELAEIHRLKPTAVMPYRQLDELHHNVSYDSLFGAVDVMKLWDQTPPDSELAGADFWYLMDRRQRLLLKGGPIYNDIHWARVLLTDDAVEKDRELSLDIDLSNSFNQLVTARRLRKGSPPLSGEVEGSKVIFKDLRPGDAIEVHYREWETSGGDFWHDFWRSYYILADQYQRYWEYTLLTDRDDIKYKADSPALAPKTDTYCGYKRIKWSGEKVAGVPSNLELAPPSGTFTGRIVVSTISSWDEVNAWYHSVSEAVLGDNPRTAELARKLTRGLQTDQEKLAALYKYIALGIPYQIVRFGYEGAVPQKPDEVLLRRWGDCKDKAHLLIKMLREVGIEAWPVLVLTRETNVDMPVPSIGFDHLITACKIGNDTTFVDASGTYYPLSHTLSWDDASQPRLLVSSAKSVQLGKLPPIQAKDAVREWQMEVWLTSAAPYRFVMTHTFKGISAGNRRSVLNNHAASGLKQLFESSYSETWKTTLHLDSLKTDTLLSVDSLYSEKWFGTIALDVQAIDNLSIVKLPSWCLFDDGLMSGLTHDGRRSYPVDLRYRTGVAKHTIIVHVPADMGAPTLGKPIEAADSLMQFAYMPEWNETDRVLTLKYETTISDGQLPLERFQKFAEQVMNVYRKPIVVQPEKQQ